MPKWKMHLIAIGSRAVGKCCGMLWDERGDGDGATATGSGSLYWRLWRGRSPRPGTEQPL